MTQEEIWTQNYQQIVEFMEATGRRPSKHRVEEHRMLNWLKHNRRVHRNGVMPESRKDRFEDLLRLCDKCLRVNQYAYAES